MTFLRVSLLSLRPLDFFISFPKIPFLTLIPGFADNVLLSQVGKTVNTRFAKSILPGPGQQKGHYDNSILDLSEPLYYSDKAPSSTRTTRERPLSMSAEISSGSGQYFATKHQIIFKKIGGTNNYKNFGFNRIKHSFAINFFPSYIMVF